MPREKRLSARDHGDVALDGDITHVLPLHVNMMEARTTRTVTRHPVRLIEWPLTCGDVHRIRVGGCIGDSKRRP